MKAVILAGGLGTRISEETHDKPSSWRESGFCYSQSASAHGINEFVICCGYKVTLLGYFTGNLLHMSDVTFHMRMNSMEVTIKMLSLGSHTC